MKKSLLLSLSSFVLSQYVNAVDVDNLNGKNFATFNNQKGFEFPLNLGFSIKNNPEKLIIDVNNIRFELLENIIKINNKEQIIVPDDFKIEQKDNHLEIFAKDIDNGKKRNNNDNLLAKIDQNRLQEAFKLLNKTDDSASRQIIYSAKMYLVNIGSATYNLNRLQSAFDLFTIAVKKLNDSASQHMAQTCLAYMYLNNIGPAANDLNRLQKAFDLFTIAVNKIDDSESQHMAQTCLAYMYLNNIGPAANDLNRLQKAFDLFTIAVKKKYDSASQHMAQACLAKMHLANLGSAGNCHNRVQKAFDLLNIAAYKTDDSVEQHIAQICLARMYLASLGPAANDLNRLQKAFDLFTIAAYKTDDLASEHMAQVGLAHMYLNNLGPAVNDQNRLQKAFDLFTIAVDKAGDPMSHHMAQIELVSMYFNAQIPLLNEFRIETALKFFIMELKNLVKMPLKYELMIKKLVLKICESPDHKSALEAVFMKDIAKEPANMDLKLIAYLICGAYFQEEYNQFIVQYWSTMNHNQKVALCQHLINRLDVDNPRLQELLILLGSEGGNHSDAVSIYAGLLAKLKDSYVHTPSIFALKVEGENEQTLHFAVNSEIFDYLPASQEALADLNDVDFILGVNVDPDLKKIRNNHDFKKYFEAPFTEESMMIQAMVKKFKKMGESGLKKLAFVMHDMNQCGKGKNQAIWDHYSIESKPLCFAELKNITDWLICLKKLDIDVSRLGRSKSQLVELIENMIKPEHIFRRHLTNLKTEEAQLLKALLGSVVEFEKNDRIDLKETLKLALNILIKLSNAEDFYKNLSELCEVYEIYLPANKFGDQLSSVAIEDLIQKLKSDDVKGRDDLSILQDKMRIFVNNEDFLALLHNFESETGNKLRELIQGCVRNGWAVGLLSLMDSANGQTLEIAVDVIYEHIKIDKDVPLTWDTLKIVVIKELIDLKRQSINAIAEKLTGKKYNIIPHQIGYIEDLLGSVIGLRDAYKTANFDFNMKQSAVASKSLQEVLDLFHENFTADKIVNHVKEILNQNKLSIIHPETGINIIWEMVGIAAKDQLLAKGIDAQNVNDLLYDDTGVKQLALPLLLVKLGILQEVGEDGHPIVNNDMIID